MALRKGGLECLGADGLQTVVVFSVDDWEDYPRPKSQRLSIVRNLSGSRIQPPHSHSRSMLQYTPRSDLSM